MADWTFHPRYVSPFYLQLMGGNLARLAPDARETLRAEFHACAAELSEGELLQMLRSSWRPSTIGAWFVAARRCTALQPEIERFILARPGHVAPMCLCLAHLGGESAAAVLSRYVDECTAGRLQMSPCDESLTPEWALCAWSHLAGEPIEPRWREFLEAEMGSLRDAGWFERSPGLERRLCDGWNARLAGARAALPLMLAFAEPPLRERSVR
jgi:hypothetical protein